MSPREVEPQHGERREHLALVRDRRRVHDVVGGDAVGGDHQQVVAELVELADLAAGQQGQAGHVLQAS